MTKERGFLSILIFVGIVIIALIAAIIFLLVNRSKIADYAQSLANNTIAQPDSLPKASFLIAFIRDGDVWVSNIDGSNTRQITNHKKLIYHWQHVEIGKLQVLDVTDSYARLPKVSFDGRYLAYESFTDESINQLAEREKRIATESAEDKNQGLSEIFDDPSLKYKLHLYDLKENQEVNLSNDESNPDDFIGGGYSSVYWARRKNTLVFVKHFNLHLITSNSSQSDKPFTDTIIVKNFCGLNCSSKPDPLDGDVLRVSPDGLMISAEYRTGEICRSGLEYKLYLVNLVTYKDLRQPANSAWCYTSVGPWLDNDRFINVEYQEVAHFYQYYKEDLRNKKLLFIDNDYQFKGPVNISPDGKYIFYPLGKYTYGSDGNIDLRIRNLQSEEYFDLLKLLKNNPDTSGNRVKYAKWDLSGKYIYFELEDEVTEESKLVRFDIDSKVSKVLIKNASQIDIN